MLIEGFEWRQVVRLTDLQAIYPHVEWVDNNQQFGRLCLMRWMYQNRRYADDAETQ